MIDYKYFDLFLKNSIPKKIKIEFDGITLKNDDLHNQEMTLEENICSEESLIFGSCESSVLKFKTSNVFFPMLGKWFDVKLYLDGNTDCPFLIGRYKVQSDKITADRKYREIVAYDAMYDIINSNVISWYNTILPDKYSKVTMRQFRESFIGYFGLEEVLPVIGKDEKGMDIYGLVNDNIAVEKTIQVGENIETDTETEQVSILKDSALSGKDVITAICEINGCFGHIGRDGKFRYIYLNQDIGGLYPSDKLFPGHAPEHLAQSKTGHLYPQDPDSLRIGKSEYIECDWENYFTRRITKLQIRNKENDIGKIWPEEDLIPEDNCYIIEDNFLVYGKSDQELREIAKNIFDKITDITYMPFRCDVIGNPCLEVGDAVRIPTEYDIVESYVLKRTFKGIQALRDEIGSSGAEEYKDNVNGVQSSIIQLKGKTNELYRNVEETRLEMRDTDKELSNKIVITAEETRQEIKNTKEGLETEISTTAAGINETIKNTKKGLETKISKTVKSIEMSVSNNKTGKTAEVKLLITDEGGTKYEVTADKIDLTGLVSFTNLETGGQTIINGNNITTGEINCSLLNGGEINGQKIVGGEVNGATVKAKEGLYLQYINRNNIPPTYGEYVFAETGTNLSPTGGISNDSFLVIKDPHENNIMISGIMAFKDFDDPNQLQLLSAAYFPGGFITDNAMINHLRETHRKNVYRTDVDADGNILAAVNANVKVFGAFVCVYGTYEVNSQTSGAAKFLSLGDSGDDYIPKWAAVRTLSSESGKMFMFTLDTSGRFIASNKSGTDITKDLTLTFRFDFVRT